MSTNVAERARRELFLSSVIQGAKTGDPRSIAALVERLTPALIVQASHRLGPTLRRQIDPQDVVNDVWLAALPRIAEFTPKEGSASQSLLAYLGVSVLRRIHRLQKIHFAKPGAAVAAPGPTETMSQLSAETTGIVSKVVKGERHAALHAAVAELDELDRAVVVLRALEQLPNEAVAAMTGLQPNAVSQRLRRALAKLRERLPNSVFDDLDDS